MSKINFFAVYFPAEIYLWRYVCCNVNTAGPYLVECRYLKKVRIRLCRNVLGYCNIFYHICWLSLTSHSARSWKDNNRRNYAGN